MYSCKKPEVKNLMLLSLYQASQQSLPWMKSNVKKRTFYVRSYQESWTWKFVCPICLLAVNCICSAAEKCKQCSILYFCKCCYWYPNGEDCKLKVYRKTIFLRKKYFLEHLLPVNVVRCLKGQSHEIFLLKFVHR